MKSSIKKKSQKHEAKSATNAEEVLKLLAHHLGVEPEDIKNDDSLVNDLHMEPTEISDFKETLESEGIDTETLDITEVDTVENLIESLNLEE